MLVCASYTHCLNLLCPLCSQQKRDMGWPAFVTKITRDSKIPWMNDSSQDFEYTMEGLDKQFNKETWLSGKVPKISVIPRFRDDLTGANLKRFMHEKIVMQEGEGSDRIIGVTSPQLVQYLRLQEEREREEKKARERARDQEALL